MMVKSNQLGIPQENFKNSNGSFLVMSFDNVFCWKLSKNVSFTQKVSVHWGLHMGQ